MMSPYELQIKLRTIAELGGFDALAAKAKQSESAMKGMENTTNAAAKKMKTDLDQVNNSNFNGLNNKFSSTIRSMVSTSASGAKAIGQNLSNMTDGIDGAITSVAAGMGVMELFDKAMDKSLSTTQLHNIKNEKDAQTVTDQWLKFTTASSASDDDISKMIRFTYQGNSNDTYRALNSLDAASYSADKLQRSEGIRGWGTYLTGGWSAAAGMMKDEPLTADQKKYLMAADTYEERMAALEKFSKEKGNLDAQGNSLSTTTEGTLGKYNQTLAAQDAIVRGATASFETLMTWIAPVIAAFMALDPSIQSTIGTVLTAGIVITAAAAGLGILVRVLSPVGNGVKAGIDALKSALGGSSDVKKGMDNVKNALNGSKLTSTVNIKAATVNVNGKTTGTGPNNTTTTTTTTTTPPPSTWSKITGLGYKIANAGIPLASGALGSYLATYGLPTSTRLSAMGMSAVGSVSRGLTSFGGSLGIPLQGLFLNQHPDVQGSGGLLSGNWSWDYAKKGIGNVFPADATNPNVKGSLADQLNLPGWLNGNAVPWLDSLKGITMPDLGIDKWFQDFKPSQMITDWWNSTTSGWKLPDVSLQSILDTIKGFVLGTLGLPGNLTWEQVKEEIRKKIFNALGLPGNLSWSRVGGWVLGKIYGFLGLPGNLSWGMIQGWIMDAVGLGGGNAAGENADAGYGTGPYYEPVVTTTSSSKTTKQTVINAPITIESISNREEGDRAITAVTNHLNQFNNANGN